MHPSCFAFLPLVGTLCVMHRCVKNTRMSESQIHRFFIFHMSGSEIHRFPIMLLKKTLVRIREPSVCGSNNHSAVGRAAVKNRSIQHFFHIFKSENCQFFFVLVFPIQTRNQRILGFQLFYGIPVMSLRNRCYNLLGSVTLR
jgi:hypothetical protein